MILATTVLLAAAEESPTTADPLTALREVFEESKAEVFSVTEKFDLRYHSELMKLEGKAATAGDLELVVAVRAEAKGFKNRAADAELSAHPELAQMQKIYTEQTAKNSTNQRSRLLDLAKNHRPKLIELRTELTKGGEIKAALVVRDEIESLDAFVRKLRAGAAVAGLDPEPQKPVGPPPAEKLSVTGATPVLVVKSFRASRGWSEPADNVITFHAPRGDGRSGAVGILVKSDGGGTQGSTWMFDYTRAGSTHGLQIIHPRDKGHAIIHIEPEGIGISTPGEWRKAGYGPGDTGEVRTTEAFADIFPLKDGQHKVASRMDHNGAGEVFVDGELVATFTAKAGEPLSLKIRKGVKIPGGSSRFDHEFTGDGLPLEWEEHWAGIVVGPTDNGKHYCVDVRYCAGIAEVPK